MFGFMFQGDFLYVPVLCVNKHTALYLTELLCNSTYIILLVKNRRVYIAQN